MEKQDTVATTKTIPSIIVRIPNGVMLKVGESIQWFHYLKLRELDGYDEQFVADLNCDSLPSVKTNALLERLVSLLHDDGMPVPPLTSSLFSYPSPKSNVERQYGAKPDNDFISEGYDGYDGRSFELLDMTIGDRTVVLLNLQKIMFGETMHCEICCPLCKNAVFIDIPVSNMLQGFAEVSSTASEHEINVDEFFLKVRLPTTKDQEALISLDKNTTNMLEYSEFFARSLIVSSKPNLPKKLSEGFLNKLSLKMQILESHSDIIINIECHSCEGVFQTPFFVEDFIFKELSARQKLFEQEIHWLAFYYHWSENDILSLSIKQRKRYVQHIARSLLGEDDE